MALSVVIPVFNAEQTLEPLVAAVEKAIQPELLELILVNDGSRDGSWDVICQLASEKPWVRGVNLMRNFGQHNALLCGIRAARGEVIVTMDDDLQNPPEEIPAMLAKLREGHDVVYGTPLHETHGLVRDLASRITKLTLRHTMGAAVAPDVSAFRAFRTHLRDAFERYGGPYVSIDVLLAWSTDRFSSVKVRHNPRTRGTSNYTWIMLTRHAVNMLTGFSTVPLRLSSFLGFGLTLFGVAVFIYVLVRYLMEGGSVPGFPFLASIIAIFSGAQLFSLGIIGEYLARIHSRTMEKPSYTVRSTTP
jgi:undecaprenyl-phosphate 4-deoxy-4-formamido-L-arabinose transferase